jgi:hypothetical protein
MLRIFFVFLAVLTWFSPAFCAELEQVGIQNIVGVCSGAKQTYVLHQDGVVYAKRKVGFVPLELPDQMIQIEEAGGKLYLLRLDGSVWQYHESNLRLIDDSVPTAQILPLADQIYLLRESGDLVGYKEGQFRILMLNRNLKVMVAYRNQVIFLLDAWGRVHRYHTYHEFMELLGPGPGGIQMVSGGDHIFVLRRGGKVQRYEDLKFQDLNSDRPVRTLAASGSYLFYIDVDRKLWEVYLPTDRRREIEVHGHPDQLFATGNELYITVMEGGQTFRYPFNEKNEAIRRRFHQLWNTSDFYNPRSKLMSR